MVLLEIVFVEVAAEAALKAGRLIAVKVAPTVTPPLDDVILL